MGVEDANEGKDFTAFVHFFCKCGWVVVLTHNEIGHCENPRCPDRAVAYQVLVKIVELKPRGAAAVQ